MRDKQHYLDMFERNPHASIGFTLAAAAVYAAHYGMCEPRHHATEEWRHIARDLKETYGEELTQDEVLFEMDGAIVPNDLITQTEAAKIAGVSIKTINQAISTRKLRNYRKPGTPKHKPGVNLVSEAEVRSLW